MSEKKAGLVDVTLAKNHKHAGTDHSAGARIKVSELERLWLIEQQIVAAPPAAKESEK